MSQITTENQRSANSKSKVDTVSFFVVNAYT